MGKYNWIESALTVDDSVRELSQRLNISLGLSAILVQRGFDTYEKAYQLLHPSIDQFRNPFLLHDMQKACDRIYQAIDNGEKITVYGDYDADGITSTTIMYETLCILGADAHYFIPNRFIDGYGPNPKRFKEIADNGTKLVITVDNGIVATDSVNLANELGMDVIVTDHHEMGAELPDAYAIVYAKYPGDEYPFDDFSGAGIAFKVSCALLDTIPFELMGVAAIGTIGDLVSVTDENRVIVKLGLAQLSHTLRPGLQAMIKNAGVNVDDISEENIGFKFAPRFNALGRMGDAEDGVELLTTVDRNKAIELANLCELQNAKRQALVAKIQVEAEQMATDKIKRGYHTLVIGGKNWHQGVLGIVASHIVEQFSCPAIVMTYDANTDSYKGSGRSVEGFDLFKALDDNRDRMIAFGGHAMACGLGVKASDMKNLQDHLDAGYIKQTHGKKLMPKLNVTASLSPSKITMDFYESLKSLSPFGTNNAKPDFEISPVKIVSGARLGQNQDTVKFVLDTGLVVMGFGMGNQFDAIMNANSLRFVGTLSINYWKNKATLQFMIKDFKL